MRKVRNVSMLLVTLFIALSIPLVTYTIQQQQLTRSNASGAAPSLGQQTVKVLVMNYFPLDSSGNSLDVNETDYASSLPAVQAKVDDLTQLAVQAMTNGTKYHGYKDISAQPSGIFQIYDTKEFLKAMPYSNYQAWSNPTVRPDYKKMLTDDVAICDYVDNHDVREVWVWGYHNGNPGGIEPDESNMSMGTTSQAFWNHGTYGDVSNGQQIDDLPTCNKSYVLYNYNYAAGLGNVLEDHGHQIERMLDFADSAFWNSKFRNPHGLIDGTVNHCGWIHSPPNVTDLHQYNWYDETVVQSDCQNWKPDGAGEPESISCHTWNGSSCADDDGAKYKVWWMQNLPGLNNGLTYQGAPLRNWWDFYTNFDNAVVQGKWLYDISQVPTPTPTITPTPINCRAYDGNITACDNTWGDSGKQCAYYFCTNQCWTNNTPVETVCQTPTPTLAPTLIPTNTPVPPTATPTTVPTLIPTNTPIPLPTHTPVPPIATPTIAPTLTIVACQRTKGGYVSTCGYTAANNADASYWASKVGRGYDANADFNGDNKVNILDFNLWRSKKQQAQ